MPTPDGRPSLLDQIRGKVPGAPRHTADPDAEIHIGQYVITGTRSVLLAGRALREVLRERESMAGGDNQRCTITIDAIPLTVRLRRATDGGER